MPVKNFVDIRPPVVELVGPAGSGKSSLMRELLKRDIDIEGGVELSKIQYWYSLLCCVTVLFPALVAQRRRRPLLDLDEARAMVYLHGWHRILEHRADHTVILLDHGPIFRLVKLSEFGSEISKSPRFITWRETMMRRWAKRLDLIVWLDAPNDILLNRIHSRNQKHILKTKNRQEADEFLSRYRSSYKRFINDAAASGKVQILHIDTCAHSLESSVECLLSALGSLSSSGGRENTER